MTQSSSAKSKMPKNNGGSPAVFDPIKKPNIILIHGFRGSPIGLRTIAKHLEAADYKVHVPAIPPFGGATTLTEYTAENYAKYLLDYISKHNLDHPVLVGHSMGSIVAAATAALYPDKINRKLILMSPISAKTAKPFALISPLSSLAPRRVVDYVTTRFLFIPHNHTLFREALDTTNLCSADHPPTRKAMAKATYFSAHSAIADFSLRQDILLLAGDQDRLVSKQKTIELADALQAQLVFIPGSGHLHNYEKPLETAEYIIDFLQQ